MRLSNHWRTDILIFLYQPRPYKKSTSAGITENCTLTFTWPGNIRACVTTVLGCLETIHANRQRERVRKYQCLPHRALGARRIQPVSESESMITRHLNLGKCLVDKTLSILRGWEQNEIALSSTHVC